VLQLRHYEEYERISIESHRLWRGGYFSPKFPVEEDVSHQPFVHGWLEHLMAYRSAAESFRTKKHCSRSTFMWKTVSLGFWAPPPFEALMATYDVDLRLIGKPIVNFLLMISKLFCWIIQLRCYEQITIASRCFRRGGSIWPKISNRRGHPHQPMFLSKN